MAELVIPVLAALGGILATVLSFMGVRYAARQSARAAEGTTAAANRQVDVSEWQALLDQFKEQVDRLTDRVEKLEKAVEEKDTRNRSLMSYLRVLLAYIHHTFPGHTPPLPPTDLVDELAYITER